MSDEAARPGPSESGQPQEPSPGVTPPPGTLDVGDTLRAVAVAALAGAAVVHFAYAPTHFDEQTSHGVFFLAVAWAQVAAALALVRWRRRPEPWLAAAALSAGVLAVWLGSRTVGVPSSHDDGVGFADALASALEVVVLAAAVVSLSPSLARRPAPRLNPLAAGVAALALVGVVSASVTPSIAGGHLAGSDHGDHGEAGEVAAAGHGDHGDGHGVETVAVAPEERCDLGFNTVRYNTVSRPGEMHHHDDDQPVDFTLEQWADVFVDPRGPIPAAAVVDYLERNPVLRDGVLSGGLTHTLAPDPWIPMTDEAECEQLADELRQAREVAGAFPTAADAEAAGYRKITNYYPGIAAHYINDDYVDERFEIERPEMLLYDGDGPGAGMVGLSYYVLSDGGPPSVGFTGPNDHYHRHLGLCFRDGVVISGSNTSEDECAAEGGTKGAGFDGWMNHVWIVPGCESDWGLYSGANPALRVRGLDNTGEVATGCGTGLALDDDLAFDTGGDGPRL